MPRLSILTISYRDPVGLETTLRSLMPLLEQQLDWQHVIVDSSPGLNDSIFRQLEDRWPVLRIKTEPKGIYEAFNTGLQYVDGAFVWILNGGDRLRDMAALRRLVARMEAQPALDMVCAAADLTRGRKFLYTHYPAATFRQSLIGANRLCHQGVIYRRSAMERVGAFRTSYRIAGDYEHHLRCYIAKLCVVCSGERLVEYDMGGASTNWRAAIAECRRALADLQHCLPRTFYLESALAIQIEFVRLWSIKALSASPLAARLQPLWLLWNRKKAARWTQPL